MIVACGMHLLIILQRTRRQNNKDDVKEESDNDNDKDDNGEKNDTIVAITITALTDSCVLNIISYLITSNYYQSYFKTEGERQFDQ